MTFDTPTLADRAYDVIEEMIVTLKLAPGTVFSEAELSERIGIGRTPLREALQRLIADRLVVSMPRRGMVITEINMVDFLALLETRRVLDRLVVSCAARRATPEQRRALEAHRAIMQRTAIKSDIEAFMRADRETDEIIEAAARNAYATQAVAPLHAHCRRFWYAHQHEGGLQRSAKLHSHIIEAVIDRQEAAATHAADALIDYLEHFTREQLEL